MTDASVKKRKVCTTTDSDDDEPEDDSSSDDDEPEDDSPRTKQLRERFRSIWSKYATDKSKSVVLIQRRTDCDDDNNLTLYLIPMVKMCEMFTVEEALQLNSGEELDDKKTKNPDADEFLSTLEDNSEYPSYDEWALVDLTGVVLVMNLPKQ